MRDNSYNEAVKALSELLQGSPPDKRVMHRLHAVIVVLHGLSASETAQIFGDSPRAVSYWVKRFKKDGITGLQEEQRSGRPGKLTPNQMKRVQTFVEQSAKKGEAVNAQAVASFIKSHFKVVLTSRQCWRILKRLR